MPSQNLKDNVSAYTLQECKELSLIRGVTGSELVDWITETIFAYQECSEKQKTLSKIILSN